MVCAETIAKGLGGRKVARGWMVRCPAHDDRKPSLSIRDADDGKVLVFCHAGCDQEQVIANLRSLGLWAASDRRRFRHAESRRVGKRTEQPFASIQKRRCGVVFFALSNEINRLATEAGDTSPPIDAVIETSQWRGYRLNPDAVRIVAFTELTAWK